MKSTSTSGCEETGNETRRECVDCTATTSTRWYKRQMGKYQCHRCYCRQQHSAKKLERNSARRVKYQKDPTAVLAKCAERRLINPGQRAQYYQQHRAQELAKQKEYRRQNRQYHLQRLAAYRAENKLYFAQYRAQHRGKDSIRTYLRKLSVAQATPKWVDLKAMIEFYDNRPDGHQVDHIHPIKHPLVCGLNVPWNLQYLPISENASKCNQFDGTYNNEGWRERTRSV